jgi:hypothetical protein
VHKITATAILLCLLQITGFAQTKELLGRMATYRLALRYSAEKKPDSVIRLARKQPSRDSLYLYGIEELAAEAYFTKGDTANGLKYLRRSVELQQVNGLDNMKYIYKKYALDSNAAYKKLIANFDEIFNKYSPTLNRALLNECLEIFHTDQRLRWIWLNTRDTTEQKAISLTMWRSDSINVENMKTIFRKHGRYPGISDIGNLQHNFTFIFAHLGALLPADTMYTLLRNATLAGQLPNWVGPYILDKTEANAGRPLIYGEYGTASDYKGDTYVYRDIADVENVDKRRAEFLLEPLWKEAERKKAILPKGYTSPPLK